MAVSLEVQERAVRPRSIRNQLRHEGKVPAVVYGYQIESTPIALDGKELAKIVRENGSNVVITMTIGGKKINTLIHKAQLDTFTKQAKHVEFLAVNMNVETEVEAEVVLVGDAVGVKAGGTLAQTLYTVVVSATPDKLPERVEVDITALNIGGSLTVGDLPKNSDYTIVTDAEEQIASIVEAQAEVAEDEETAEAPAEPETSEE